MTPSNLNRRQQLYIAGPERPQYIIKMKIHSSCEIEYFVETHLCKQLCVILRSRVLRIYCSMIYHLFTTAAAAVLLLTTVMLIPP